VNFCKSAPTPALADWAKAGIEGIVEAQKRWADIASSRQAVHRSHARGPGLTSMKSRGPCRIHQSGVEAFVKRAPGGSISRKANELALKTLKDNLDLDENSPATALADFAEQAVTNYIEVQKRWLDLATQLPFLRPAEKK
jgi:hypothetical protein